MNAPRLPERARAGVRKALTPVHNVCEDTAFLFALYIGEKHARQVAHLDRIEAEAHRLGGEVARYCTTMQEATARLERLCDRLDEMSPVPLRMVPLAIGRQVARAAFATGMATVERKAVA